MLGWVINLGGGREMQVAHSHHILSGMFLCESILLHTISSLSLPPSLSLSSPSPAQPIPLPSTQGFRLRAQTVSDLLVITTSPLVAG